MKSVYLTLDLNAELKGLVFMAKVPTTISSVCPKGVPDEKCPGNGDPVKCKWYRKQYDKCFYIPDEPSDRVSWLPGLPRTTETTETIGESSVSDELKQLYADLQREYDSVLDRRKTLTGQAASLLSFAGIIQTVLIGLMISLATNSAARTLLQGSQYYSAIVLMAAIGFISYIMTAVFSLFAFIERKWDRVPVMPDKDPLDSIQFFYSHKGAYCLEKIAMQFMYATGLHQDTNDEKYRYLSAGFIFLLIGIIATAIAGFILLVTIG